MPVSLKNTNYGETHTAHRHHIRPAEGKPEVKAAELKDEPLPEIEYDDSEENDDTDAVEVVGKPKKKKKKKR